MARDPQPTSRSRRRVKPVQVQAKTPWGFIAGATVLGLLLVGVLVYAALNSGAGFQDPLKKADGSFDGLVTADEASLTRNHVEGAVDYPQTPPSGGNHAGQWQNCNGDVYPAPINSENAVHAMEHGAAWVTYKPDLAPAQVALLRKAVQNKAYTLLSPLPEQKDAVVLTSWGRQLKVSSASDPAVQEFVDTYANGPQTPEKGATCGGGVAVTRTATAPAPSAPAASAPAASAPAAGAPAASTPAG